MKLTTKQLERWVEDCKHLPQNEPAAMAKELLLLRAGNEAEKEVIKAAIAWAFAARLWGSCSPEKQGRILLETVKKLNKLNKKKGSAK